MSRPKGSKNKIKTIIVKPTGENDDITIQKAIDSLSDNDDDIEEIPNELEIGLNQEGLTLEPKEESVGNDGIMINKNWKLTSDSLNVILSKKSIIRKGKSAGTDKWLVKGYYGTIKGALESMVDKEILGTGLKNLQIVDDKIDELKATIVNLPIGHRNL